MSKYHEIIDRLIKNETVYLKSDFEQIVMRLEKHLPSATLKPKGGSEYKADVTSKIVNDILLEADQITQKEYENY